jgi:hypothetical protein
VNSANEFIIHCTSFSGKTNTVHVNLNCASEFIIHCTGFSRKKNYSLKKINSAK